MKKNSFLYASTPMLTTIATEIGFLTKKQAVGLRRAVILDVEMRKEETRGKVEETVRACGRVLHTTEACYIFIRQG